MSPQSKYLLPNYPISSDRRGTETRNAAELQIQKTGFEVLKVRNDAKLMCMHALSSFVVQYHVLVDSKSRSKFPAELLFHMHEQAEERPLCICLIGYLDATMYESLVPLLLYLCQQIETFTLLALFIIILLKRTFASQEQLIRTPSNSSPMRIPCFDVLIELLISLIVIVLQYRGQIIEDVLICLFRKVQLLENALLDPFFDLGYVLIFDRPFNTLRLV